MRIVQESYVEFDEDILITQVKNIEEKPGLKDYIPQIIGDVNLSSVARIKLTKDDFEFNRVIYYFDYKLYDILAQLNYSKLAYLCVGGFISNKNESNEKNRRLNGLTSRKIKKIKNYLRMSDGPTGITK